MKLFATVYFIKFLVIINFFFLILGIPDSRPLENGDIINLDISTYKYGMHADLNETFVLLI